MDSVTQQMLADLRSDERAVQNAAYYAVMEQTSEPVDWAYEVWDDLLTMLRHTDNHQRAIGAQVLSNLAKSDPEYRMGRDFAALLAVTKDKRFVTARHALQSLWHVGVVGEPQRRLVVEGLSGRFDECSAEKNCTLIRYDIIGALRKLYDAAPDEMLRARALSLIETEENLKYRKKYAGLWKKEPRI